MDAPADFLLRDEASRRAAGARSLAHDLEAPDGARVFAALTYDHENGSLISHSRSLACGCKLPTSGGAVNLPQARRIARGAFVPPARAELPCVRRVCATFTLVTAAPQVGFLGLGLMGQPMALNLARSGVPLTVWNRSPEKCEPLRAAGATVASSPAEVCASAEVVFAMMVNEEATDAVLARGTPAFAEMIRGRTIVCMSSNAPEYSRALGADIAAADGRYVEAPVSGSRKPAEAGQLVALLAGEPEVVTAIAPLFAPMCRATVRCGAVGNGLLMKLSINLVLNQLIAALAEAVHFADRHALDLHAFEAAFNAGSMASDLTRVKIPKLAARDFSPQAATTDALNSQRTIAAAARAADLATPLLDAGIKLYEETVALGHGRLDMVSVLHAIEARTDAS